MKGQAAAAAGCTLAAVLLVACSASPPSGSAGGSAGAAAGAAAGEPPAALQEEFLRRETGQPASSLQPELRARLLARLQRLEAAAARATASDAHRARGEIARVEALAQVAAEEAGVYQAPGEAQLREAYARFVAALPATDYHVAHILVATEGAALVALARLGKGESFGSVAAALSADESRSRGGDLGWIQPGKLPQPFIDAVTKLKPGEFTHSPVRTPYGLHIIRLEAQRATSAPAYESVKAQLAATLQAERYEAFLGR